MTDDHPSIVSGPHEKVEDALMKIGECLDFWLDSPGQIVVSFRMTRHGWTDDWKAWHEPDPTCSSCGQHIESEASAPVS